MPVRVDVTPRLVEWAVERSGRGFEYLADRFPGLSSWIGGTERPTLRQLESFADATYTPVGYLFLQEPPVEPLPIPDLRTVRDVPLASPSPNLLDTIFQSQIRQDWYRSWAAAQDADDLAFVASLTTNTLAVNAAQAIRQTIRFRVPASRDFRSWTAAVTGLADALGDAGILVMINGVVGTNTHRILNPAEFRGFTLADSLAPLIFVNGADSKAAQMFTLAHEAAHVWAGRSGVGNSRPGPSAPGGIERWANSVAAELLVPLDDVRLVYNSHRALDDQLQELAGRYRVSRLVVLSRIFEAGFLPWDAYRTRYDFETARAAEHEPRESGGNFYSTLTTRVGKRFLRALVSTTLAGGTMYSDAFRMLGIREQRVFDEISHRIDLP